MGFFTYLDRKIIIKKLDTFFPPYNGFGTQPSKLLSTFVIIGII